MKEISKIEIKDKINLTVEEASVYSNIGLNTIREILKQPNCPFSLYIGNRVLVKRKAFEQYLEKISEI